MQSEALAHRVAELALERKGLDVVLLDVRGLSSYTDFIVIASGTSDRHVRAVAEHIEGELTKARVKPIGQEGVREGQWALVDFGAVVLHVFHQYNREVYDLETLWKGAPRQLIDDAPPASEPAHA